MSQPITKERQRMRSEAEEALAASPQLDCPGFECARVFALLDKLLRDPPAGVTRKRLVKRVGTIFQFVVRPTEPIDPSNPRTRPEKGQGGGGALRPALWYVDLKHTGTIGRGQPPKTVMRTKRRPDVIIECIDKDLLHMAQGQQHPQKLFNIGRIKVKGNLDRAMSLTTILNQERSRLFGVPPAQAPAPGDRSALAEFEREGNAGRDSEYGAGAPAPIPNAKL
ncbi:unnamed protein product [Parajaminaea phylloscopi]